MTANQSKIGLKFDTSDSSTLKLTGKIEFDFYGGGAENKPNPMMRHAYFELQSPLVNLLAGQTSDLFSPLNPTTLNYVVMWRCGNTGYRRPQLRLTKDVSFGEKSKLTLGLSFNRSMGDLEEGEDAGVPTVEYRLGISHKLLGSQPTILGISGVEGKQESDFLDTNFVMNAFAVDLVLPLGNKVAITGEVFSGKNLSVFMGGIGQGIDGMNKKEIGALGWWGQLSIYPTPKIELNIGSGDDNPELAATGLPVIPVSTMEDNMAYFGNIIYKLSSSVSFGVEHTIMATKYSDDKTFKNNRTQASFIYRF
jgi:hypothetical protein